MAKTNYITVEVASQRGYTQVKVNGKCIYLGSYETLLEAVEARKAADKKYNFHPNHGTNESAYTRNR